MIANKLNQFIRPLLFLKPLSVLESNHLCRLFSDNRYPPKENPIFRAINLVKEDIRETIVQRGIPKKNIFPSHCDIVIIGGGLIGCSIAFWLKYRALEGLNVVVVEKDPMVMLSDNVFDKIKYQQCSSCLSVGGIRQQFSLRENIELSLKSAEFLRNIKDYLSIDGCDLPDIQFCPSGYLFLASEKGAHILEENYALQRSLGAEVEMLSREDLNTRFPWLNTEGIVAATHGIRNEGWFDPYSLLTAFRLRAAHLGVEFVSGEVTGFIPEIASEDIVGKGAPSGNHIHTLIVKLPDGTEKTIHFASVIIAAGGLSGQVFELMKTGEEESIAQVAPLPVEPRKRYVFNVHCPNGPGVVMPMVIDTTGAYIRRDGLAGNYLCGISPTDEEEPPVDNLDVDYSFFENKVWPIIANRIPAFQEAKVKSAWAGFYDFNKFDENAFIGPHPGFINVFLATGFSGHGVQQAPAVGKAIMELIVDGAYQTVSLERLHFNRYIDNQPLYESNIV